MNCKPGDLAVVVSPPMPGLESVVGTIVTVLKADNRSGYDHPGPFWVVKVGAPTMAYNGWIDTVGPSNAKTIWGCPDFCLRPIRPPEKDQPSPPVENPIEEFA